MGLKKIRGNIYNVEQEHVVLTDELVAFIH